MDSWSQQTAISPSPPANDFLSCSRITSSTMPTPFLILLSWETNVSMRSWKKKMPSTWKKISQMKMVSVPVNLRRNLPIWMAGMQNLMPLPCWTVLELTLNSTTLQWEICQVRWKLKSCLHRHYSEILISCCWMSRQTTLILMLSHGWKNSWSTLKILSLSYLMTVIF